MRKNRIILLIIVSLIINSLQSYGQSNTLYYMDGIHQANELNPAYQNPCNGYLALPVLSNLNFNFANTGFDFNDLIHSGTGALKDSLVIDFQKVKNGLGKHNYVLMNTDIALLGFGFWVGNSYFTFGISNKTRARIAYPKDLINMVDGNGQYQGDASPININGVGPNFINYNEFAFGLSKQITHRLTIGGKVKILAGNLNIESRTSDIRIYTAENAYNPVMRLETDLRINVSGPIKFEYDENGLISGADIDDSNIASSIISTKNMGLGIDLGATYQFNDRFKFFASVTDLGFISWRNNTVNITQKGSFVYSGLTLDSAFSNSDYSEFEALADSIADHFTFSDTDTKYSTFLNTNVFLGATYELIPEINFGLLSKTFFYDRRLHQAVTVSANFKPAKWFTASLSYSMMNREYKNVGLGFGIKGGPVQFYFVTDYLTAALQPKSYKNLGIQLGFNLYFGCGKRENYSMIKNNKPQKDIDFM